MRPHSPRIALIHATPVAVEPVQTAFAALWPEARVYNLLEDSLAPDLEAAGRIDEAMDDRFCRLARYAADYGADGILFTCSAFGRSIEAAADALAPLPVLKPNEAMFTEALASGHRIGMIATFQPSVPSMEDEFSRMAAEIGSDAHLTSVYAEGAMAALKAGDPARHNLIVADACRRLDDADLVLLAHFSTAQAAAAVRDKTSKPILTSPGSAIRSLQARIGT